MILSGNEIKNHIGKNIIIEPYDEKRINPNSYNMALHNELMVYKNIILDMKKENSTKIISIPSDGLVLEPNRLYLARTQEYTETFNLIPMLNGRSSVGRLGLSVHVTAGFGDVGFKGYWTLELFCIQPVKIYPGIEICQIYYYTLLGSHQDYNSDKYQNNTGIQSSRLYMDLKGD